MNQPILTTFALSSLLSLFGCGQTATNEPKRLDTVIEKEGAVTEEQAAPLSVPVPNTGPKSTPVAETTKATDKLTEAQPTQSQAVEQAAFAAEAAMEEDGPATVPSVLLTHQHAALCRVKVGDTMPEIELPKVEGGNAKLSALYGKGATVVVFWRGDRQMALDELADLGPDVVEKFGSRGVEVVGIAVSEPAAEAQSATQKAAADFPQLLDADGKAFDKVGLQKFPWTFVLDANGKIVWFDLEYSLATRRELQQALLATVR